MPKRARNQPASPAPAEPAPAKNPAGLDETRAAETRLATAEKERDAEIAKYSDGKPFHHDRVLLEMEFLLDREDHHKRETVMAYFEVGKRLHLLRLHAPHGEWLQAVSERFHIDPREARIRMRVAERIASLPKGETFRHLPKSQFKALLMLSDEHIKQLSDGRAVGGKTAQDLGNTSVRDVFEWAKDLKKERDELLAREENHRDTTDGWRKKHAKKEKENAHLRTENERLRKGVPEGEEDAFRILEEIEASIHAASLKLTTVKLQDCSLRIRMKVMSLLKFFVDQAHETRGLVMGDEDFPSDFPEHDDWQIPEKVEPWIEKFVKDGAEAVR